MKYQTVVFSTDRASAASQGPCKKSEVQYFTSKDGHVRSISSLLYGQKSCECSVKIQQGVSSPLLFLLNPNQNGGGFPIFKICFLFSYDK